MDTTELAEQARVVEDQLGELLERVERQYGNQSEGDEELYHGPRGVELAAEGGELRGGWPGVVVVVQALSEGY